MLCALGECGGVVGLNFFIRSFYKAIGQRRFWILQSMGCISCKNAGEDSVALGTDFDGFEAGQNWLRGIEEIECVWDALKKGRNDGTSAG